MCILKMRLQFICHLFPTKTKKESKEIILKVNEQYSDATHNCTAYIVSDGEGFDDDGEPGGTAGKPMINVLRKNDLQLKHLNYYKNYI